MFRYVDYYSVLNQHKDSGLPKHALGKKEFTANIRFAMTMAEELKSELRTEVQDKFARGIVQERERQEELARRPPEPEPEPEQAVELAPTVSLPKDPPAMDTLRGLVGEVPASAAVGGAGSKGRAAERTVQRSESSSDPCCSHRVRRFTDEQKTRMARQMNG